MAVHLSVCLVTLLETQIQKNKICLSYYYLKYVGTTATRSADVQIMVYLGIRVTRKFSAGRKFPEYLPHFVKIG